jgi:hypothetical protein
MPATIEPAKPANRWAWFVGIWALSAATTAAAAYLLRWMLPG